MTTSSAGDRPNTRNAFFITRARACPYLLGRLERNVFTELDPSDPAAMYDRLAHAGFRRSHRIAFRPACPACQACVPVRVDAAGFRRRPWTRRLLAANGDLVARSRPAVATAEQYDLFRAYQTGRHAEGEMSRMDFEDYRSMVEESPVDTFVVEFRRPGGDLAAACLADRLRDGLSAVYSFFDPAAPRRGLGNYMVLWLIGRARELGLGYVYLGYWIEDSPKMAYKKRFRPLERLGPDGWRPLEDDAADTRTGEPGGGARP